MNRATMNKAMILLAVLVATAGCGRVMMSDTHAESLAWRSPAWNGHRPAARESYRPRVARPHAPPAGRTSEGYPVRSDGRESVAGRTAEGYPIRPDRPDRRDGGFEREVQSGILTAGSLDDLDDFETYRQLVSKLRWGGNSSAVRELAGGPTVVRVVDNDGRPVGGADLEIDGANRWSTLHLRTKSNGKVVLMPSWDGVEDRRLSVRVTAPGSQRPITATVHPMQAESHTITLQQVRAMAPRQLDLAFVVDCTGSMADELEYLKVEIRSIAQLVAQRFPQVRQRFALVAYRDRGDRYVTRTYDFTSDLDTFIGNLGAQSANEGGDYPEAVHEAMAAAGDLTWASGNVARVCFHVADAPPHDDRISRTFSAVDGLRSQGVAIYPVASSGVEDLAEFTMRTEALMTGSDYLFLTDDSGVGNRHAEPTADRYNIEVLKELMVRMIAQEICGLKLGPRGGDVIRTAWGKDAWQQ